MSAHFVSAQEIQVCLTFSNNNLNRQYFFIFFIIGHRSRTKGILLARVEQRLKYNCKVQLEFTLGDLSLKGRGGG